MAQATESSVSAILKEVYPGAIEDELNNEIAAWAVLDKEKVTIDGQGQHVVRPFRVNRNQGFGARNDTDLLPLAGNQTLANAKINMSSNYMVGQITGRVMRTSYGDDAAFENALEEEIRFSLTDVATEIGRQIYNGAGQLTTVNGAVNSSTTVVVNNVQYLAVGMYVEFWKTDGTNETSNDSTLPSGYVGTQITAITASTNTITVATAQTLTTGDGVSRSASNTGFTTTKELNGFDTTIDDGTDYSGRLYFGVNRSTYPILNGNRFSANGTLTESLMQQAVDAARQIGGGITDIIFCDYATRRTYSALLTSLKRYPVDGIRAPEFAGGFETSKDLRTQLGEGLSFSGAPVVPSRQAPPKKMWFLETNSWKIFQQSEIEWIMNDGSILHPMLVNGYDAYRFSLYYDAQVYCEAPNRNSKVVSTF
jgi:hypothetical protein